MKENLHALFIPIVLIIMGILAPSNGVDDGYRKDPLELLSTAFIILLVGIIAYLILKYVEWPSTINSKNKTLK